MTNKIAKKIIFIVMICLAIIGSGIVKNVYASSEEEELIQLLDQYKSNLGNINEFKQVIDKLYNDVNSATKVDDELKEKLSLDIDGLKNVTGINPLLLNTLEVELKSQIENLTDENLEEFKHEITVIKGWTDKQLISGNETTNEDNNNVITTTQNQNLANKILPYAGKIAPILGCIAIIIVANAIYSMVKYKHYKEFLNRKKIKF